MNQPMESDMKKLTILEAAALALVSQLATAHVGLAEPSATAGSYYRATFKVGHGCEGSATTAIIITIPQGFSAVKPMPKPGWTLENRLEKPAKPHDSNGKSIDEELRLVAWKSGSLPDAQYDEFVVMLKLPDSAGKYAFKVSQQCEKGSNEWIEIPQAGQTRRDLKFPAVELEVVPAKTTADPGHRH